MTESSRPAVLHDRLDRRLGGLSIAFVEGEGRVELGLAAEQFLEARFVLERSVGLGPDRRSAFLEPLGLALFIFGRLFDTAQGVLDALNRAERIIGVDLPLLVVRPG